MLFALFLAAVRAGSPVIRSVSTSYLRDNFLREGSFEGGTLLYIKGTDFDENKSNNRITIGGLDCPVVGKNTEKYIDFINGKKKRIPPHFAFLS